jgi:histidine triad (HIT) family protein
MMGTRAEADHRRDVHRAMTLEHTARLQREACVFCRKIVEGSVDVVDLFGIYAFEPLNPVAPGHRLFVAYEHFAYPHDQPALVGLLFSRAATHGEAQGEDYNLIVNGGPVAGQTVTHVHVHYVPRRPDDGLQLPWGGVK